MLAAVAAGIGARRRPERAAFAVLVSCAAAFLVVAVAARRLSVRAATRWSAATVVVGIAVALVVVAGRRHGVALLWPVVAAVLGLVGAVTLARSGPSPEAQMRARLRTARLQAGEPSWRSAPGPTFAPSSGRTRTVAHLVSGVLLVAAGVAVLVGSVQPWAVAGGSGLDVRGWESGHAAVFAGTALCAIALLVAAFVPGRTSGLVALVLAGVTVEVRGFVVDHVRDVLLHGGATGPELQAAHAGAAVTWLAVGFGLAVAGGVLRLVVGAGRR